MLQNMPGPRYRSLGLLWDISNLKHISKLFFSFYDYTFARFLGVRFLPLPPPQLTKHPIPMPIPAGGGPLCPPEPLGSSSGHQTLVGELPSQVWLQEGSPVCESLLVWLLSWDQFALGDPTMDCCPRQNSSQGHRDAQTPPPR